MNTHAHTRSTALCRDDKGKTSLDFTEARDSEWQWYQLGHTQVCTSRFSGISVERSAASLSLIFS